MMIDNDDPRTIRPVAIIIVGKAEINACGSFRISNQYWGNNLYRFRSEIINSLSAANNSLKRNSLFLIDLSWVEWSLGRIENAILTLTRAYKCKLWTNKLLEQTELCFGECLWQAKAANDKRSRQLSPWQQDGNQPDEDQNKQQQKQPANRISWQCRNNSLPRPLLSPWSKAHNYFIASSPRLVKLMGEMWFLSHTHVLVIVTVITNRPRLPLLKPEWADGSVTDKD